jgi:hypothetical protein
MTSFAAPARAFGGATKILLYHPEQTLMMPAGYGWQRRHAVTPDQSASQIMAAMRPVTRSRR